MRSSSAPSSRRRRRARIAGRTPCASNERERRGGSAPPSAGALLAVSLASALCLARPAAGATISVTVVEVRCADASHVATQITEQLLAAYGSQPDLLVAVDAPTPSQLRVRAQGPRAARERVIDFEPRDCPELPATVATLVRRWLDNRWSETPPAAPEDASMAPPRLTAPPIAAAPAARPEVRRARVALVAGAFSGAPDGLHGPMGALSAEWNFTRWLGVGLQGSANAAVQAPVGRGHVSAAAWRASALVRASAPVAEGAFVDLLAGPGLYVLTASGSGFDQVSSAVLFDASFGATARWRQYLAGDLSALAGLTVDVSSRSHAFFVEREGARLSSRPLSAARASAFVGAAFDFQ